VFPVLAGARKRMAYILPAPHISPREMFYAEKFLAKVPQRRRLRAIIAELVLVDPVWGCQVKDLWFCSG